MKISRSLEYGLLVVGHIAKYGNNDFVTVASISRKHNIKPAQLAKIAKEFVRANRHPWHPLGISAP